MELTRRDAVATPAALGASSGAAELYRVRETELSRDQRLRAETPGDEQLRNVGADTYQRGAR
jgi:hypothetical protein